MHRRRGGDAPEEGRGHGSWVFRVNGGGGRIESNVGGVGGQWSSGSR